MLVEDELYAGLTRPAMIMGVPFELFMGNFMAVMILFLATSLFSLLLAIPIHFALWTMAQFDARMGETVRFYLSLAGRNSRSKMTWGVRSHDPLVTDKERRDVVLDGA